MKNLNLNKIYGDFSNENLMDLSGIKKQIKKAAWLTPAIAALAATDADAEVICAQPANAPVITGTLSSPGLFYVDIDGDKVDDFIFANFGIANQVVALNSNLFLVTVNAGGSFYSAANVSCGYSLNTAIPTGTICNATFGTSPSAPGGMPHFNYAYGTLNTAGSFFGNWNGTASDPYANSWGYVGVQLTNADGTFPGWIEVDINPDGSSMTVLGWGVNTCPPGAPATAVETTCPNTPPVASTAPSGSIPAGACPEADAVPTLGQWGITLLGLFFLAFGSAFAFMRRKVGVMESK